MNAKQTRNVHMCSCCDVAWTFCVVKVFGCLVLVWLIFWVLYDAAQTRLIELYFLIRDGSTNICGYMYVHIHISTAKTIGMINLNMCWNFMDDCSIAQVSVHPHSFLSSLNGRFCPWWLGIHGTTPGVNPSWMTHLSVAAAPVPTDSFKRRRSAAPVSPYGAD